VHGDAQVEGLQAAAAGVAAEAARAAFSRAL
jgi:hypothetical protein